MSRSDDIYAIAGRIKNLIAMEDLGLTQSGLYIVNAHALNLKDLHDCANKIPEPFKNELKNLIFSQETMSRNILKLATPKEEPQSFMEKFMETKARFQTNQEAYKYFKKEYESLGQRYGLTGDDFWIEAECADGARTSRTEDYNKIMTLHRQMGMCRYLMNKEKESE